MATGIVKLFTPQSDTGSAYKTREDKFVHASTVRMAGLKRLRKGQMSASKSTIIKGGQRQGICVFRQRSEDRSLMEGEESLTENDLRLEMSSASGDRLGGNRKPISH